MKQFVELLQLLSTLKGKFILSNFPSQTLKWFIIKNGWIYRIVKKQNKVSNLNVPRYKLEVLVWNYEIERNLFSEPQLETRNTQPV
jgi:DNA adenine methylase